MNNYDYPEGADNKYAPWNQEELPEKEIEVTVSVTMSKTFKIKVNDYEIIDSGKDENGNYYENIDYSECNLKEAVENQIYLPHEAGHFIYGCIKEGYAKASSMSAILDDIRNWNLDDFEVNIE